MTTTLEEEEPTSVTAAELKQEKTYRNLGWDMDTVWVIPTCSQYKLPILRGANKTLQQAQTMNID